MCSVKYYNKLAPQATTKEIPNIVLNYVYKKTAKIKKRGEGAPRCRNSGTIGPQAQAIVYVLDVC